MINKKRNTSNIVLGLLGIYLFAFIAVMTVIFCIKGSVPDTLIQYTLGAGGIESVALAAIKIVKVSNNKGSGLDESDTDS